MVKYWLGTLFMVLVLLTSIPVYADELPPGDNVIITDSIPIPLDIYTEDTTAVPDPLMVPIPNENQETIPTTADSAEVNIDPENLQELPGSLPVLTECLVAEYTTPLINSPANRNHNINLALNAINGQVIKPGGSWSFNQAVGPRTVQRGYKKAMIIVNKKFVPGVGGGICQVASTLYNVLIEAGVKVTERHPHSLPVKYVAPGRDAAISYGIQDLKFVNNLSRDIIIKTRSEDKQITIAFYSLMTDTNQNAIELNIQP